MRYELLGVRNKKYEKYELVLSQLRCFYTTYSDGIPLSTWFSVLILEINTFGCSFNLLRMLGQIGDLLNACLRFRLQTSGFKLWGTHRELIFRACISLSMHLTAQGLTPNSSAKSVVLQFLSKYKRFHNRSFISSVVAVRGLPEPGNLSQVWRSPSRNWL
jgi:hypothetical protein